MLPAAKDATDDLIGDDPQLRVVFETHYARMLRAVNELVAAAFEESFRLDDAVTRAFILEAGAQAVRVDEATKAAIREQLAAGQALGETNRQLAARIDHLFTVTWRNRAETVSRTEIQAAQLAASYNRYAATNQVQLVELRDGGTRDSDAFCNGRNGQRLPLGTRVSLAHPNCTLAIVPIVTPAEPPE